MVPSQKDAYFQRTKWHWIAFISALLLWFTWMVFWPDQFPDDMLGPLGFLSKYIIEHHHSLMYNGWWLALMIHVAEALYSLKVCRNKGLNNAVTFLWFVQTFLFGIASLGLLLKYQPEPFPKQH